MDPVTARKGSFVAVIWPDTHSFSVDRITLDQFPACWALRLRALRDHPDAFGQPAEEAEKLSLAEAMEQFQTRWDSGDNRTFGAFASDGSLLGMIGMAREPRPKTRHRVSIWGVYVAPQARGHGLSSALLDRSLAHARHLPGVLQVHLTAASHNLAAIRAYERAGFVRVGRLPRADILSDGTAVDNDLMVLMLDGHPITGCGELALPLG